MMDSQGNADDGENEAALLTEREAFLVMTEFVWQYARRAGNDLITLLGDIDTSIWPNGQTLDPAATHDWLACVELVESEIPPRQGSDDEPTSELLTERDAFQATTELLWQHARRAGDDLIGLLGRIEMDGEGQAASSEAWDDLRDWVKYVKSGLPLGRRPSSSGAPRSQEHVSRTRKNGAVGPMVWACLASRG